MRGHMAFERRSKQAHAIRKSKAENEEKEATNMLIMRTQCNFFKACKHAKYRNTEVHVYMYNVHVYIYNVYMYNLHV